MVPRQTTTAQTFCCGDLIHDCCTRYADETGQDFFSDYVQCIRKNSRMDGGDGEDSLILFEDEYCMAFIPKAQTSQWEVQIMTTTRAGNILELSTEARHSLDTAFYLIVKALHGIGVKLMAEGKIGLTGVQIPIKKEIYEPVLNGLAELNIKMVEKTV